MEYYSVKEAPVLWNTSERPVQKLCETVQIGGVLRFGRFYMILKKAKKPRDLPICRKSGEKHVQPST